MILRSPLSRIAQLSGIWLAILKAITLLMMELSGRKVLLILMFG